MNSVFVIAEAGVNHNGDVSVARQLIDAAAGAGADAVKFQTFDASALATQQAPKAAYQMTTTSADQSQLDMLRKLELSRPAHRELKQHAEDAGLVFLSTPFDLGSLSFLADDLGVDRLKIGSGDLTDGPLLLAAARTGLDLIVSTGMSTLEEISDALDIVAYGRARKTSPSSSSDFAGFRDTQEGRETLSDGITLLHCTSLYPAPADQANLRAIETIRSTFGVPVGYSDHTLGMTTALAAVALGAAIVEKHLTLDCRMDGPDHAASMEPATFGELIAAIRAVEAALGSADKVPVPAERDTLRSARKSLVAAAPVGAGTELAESNLTVKRPGDGISPIEYWDLIGTPARRDFAIDEQIER